MLQTDTLPDGRALFVIGGCSKKDPNQISTEKMQLYTAYYKSIMEMDRFQEKSDFYDLEVVMNQLPDGTYRYYVILDNPQVAMVDVEMLVIRRGGGLFPNRSDRAVGRLVGK